MSIETLTEERKPLADSNGNGVMYPLDQEVIVVEAPESDGMYVELDDPYGDTYATISGMEYLVIGSDAYSETNVSSLEDKTYIADISLPKALSDAIDIIELADNIFPTDRSFIIFSEEDAVERVELQALLTDKDFLQDSQFTNARADIFSNLTDKISSIKASSEGQLDFEKNLGVLASTVNVFSGTAQRNASILMKAALNQYGFTLKTDLKLGEIKEDNGLFIGDDEAVYSLVKLKPKRNEPQQLDAVKSEVSGASNIIDEDSGSPVEPVNNQVERNNRGKILKIGGIVAAATLLAACSGNLDSNGTTETPSGTPTGTPDAAQTQAWNDIYATQTAMANTQTAMAPTFTPSATMTPSNTPTETATQTATVVPSATFSPTPSLTNTGTQTSVNQTATQLVVNATGSAQPTENATNQFFTIVEATASSTETLPAGIFQTATANNGGATVTAINQTGTAAAQQAQLTSATWIQTSTSQAVEAIPPIEASPTATSAELIATQEEAITVASPTFAATATTVPLATQSSDSIDVNNLSATISNGFELVDTYETATQAQREAQNFGNETNYGMPEANLFQDGFDIFQNNNVTRGALGAAAKVFEGKNVNGENTDLQAISNLNPENGDFDGDNTSNDWNGDVFDRTEITYMDRSGQIGDSWRRFFEYFGIKSEYQEIYIRQITNALKLASSSQVKGGETFEITNAENVTISFCIGEAADIIPGFMADNIVFFPNFVISPTSFTFNNLDKCSISGPSIADDGYKGIFVNMTYDAGRRFAPELMNFTIGADRGRLQLGVDDPVIWMNIDGLPVVFDMKTLLPIIPGGPLVQVAGQGGGGVPSVAATLPAEFTVIGQPTTPPGGNPTSVPTKVTDNPNPGGQPPDGVVPGDPPNDGIVPTNVPPANPGGQPPDGVGPNEPPPDGLNVNPNGQPNDGNIAIPNDQPNDGVGPGGLPNDGNN